MSDKSFHQGRGSAFSEVVVDLERLFIAEENPFRKFARVYAAQFVGTDEEVTENELLQDNSDEEDPGSGTGTDVHNVGSFEGSDIPDKLIERIRDANRNKVD